MKKHCYLLIFLCLACPPLQAQKLKELYVLPTKMDVAITLRAGDKILIAYNTDYALRYPHKVYTRKRTMKKRDFGKVLYGKERVLRITDTCLIFMNGTYANYEGIFTLRKLSLGKQIGRTFGVVVGSVSLLGFPFGTAFGLWMIINNNNRLKNKHLKPCKIWKN